MSGGLCRGCTYCGPSSRPGYFTCKPPIFNLGVELSEGVETCSDFEPIPAEFQKPIVELSPKPIPAGNLSHPAGVPSGRGDMPHLPCAGGTIHPEPGEPAGSHRGAGVGGESQPAPAPLIGGWANPPFACADRGVRFALSTSGGHCFYLGWSDLLALYEAIRPHAETLKRGAA